MQGASGDPGERWQRLPEMQGTTARAPEESLGTGHDRALEDELRARLVPVWEALGGLAPSGLRVGVESFRRPRDPWTAWVSSSGQGYLLGESCGFTCRYGATGREALDQLLAALQALLEARAREAREAAIEAAKADAAWSGALDRWLVPKPDAEGIDAARGADGEPLALLERVPTLTRKRPSLHAVPASCARRAGAGAADSSPGLAGQAGASGCDDAGLPSR